MNAERVNAMGVEKDGVQCVLYHHKSNGKTKWFVVPLKDAQNLKQVEPINKLKKYLDV
jgi:hypothetical protein